MTGKALRWAAGICMVVVLLAYASIQPAQAQAQTQSQTRDFNLPAQSATTGIPEFAHQAGIQILVSEPLVRGKRIAAVTGSHSVEEALAILLKGTGLVATSKDGATYTVAAATTPSTSRNSTAPASVLAASQTSAQSVTADQSPPAPSKSDKEKAQLEEIVVTGSRIPTVAGNQVQPVRSYSREDIAVSGQSTVAEYLNTLPDVSTSLNGTAQFGLPGVQPVQLHGLPAGTTLTLIDGRRLESSVLGYFDVGNIPASAIERIEILPVGASAIYGANALGGAVNFILRKNFTGFEVNASLDHGPDVNNPGINMAWGKAWERGSVSLIASYDHRGELLGTQRDPTGSTQLPSYVTAAQAISLGADQCAPGNVFSVDGTNLPGLPAPYAAIPPGITGKPTIGDFAPTAGKLNVCNAYRYTDIVPDSDRVSGLLSAHFELTDAVDLFAEVLLAHNQERINYGANVAASASYGGTLAAANPFNPFGEDVNVSFADPTALKRDDQTVSFVQPNIGIRGTFLSDWHYEATATMSRDRLHTFEPYADPQGISNALASSNPATALNPFTTGPSGTPQLLGSLTNPAIDYSDYSYDNRSTGGVGFVRGPLFQLPAGALQAALGAEYYREEQAYLSAGGGYPITTSSLARTTYALFSEAHIPLLSAADRARQIERLTLTVAGRYDHSNDYGGKATWQSGALWRVTDAVSLSGGYGKSYAAPQLSQIAGPQTVFSAPLYVSDPFRGNQPVNYSVTQIAGPNYSLKPETGDSSTLTLGYVSDALEGVRASLTWYAINITNYIGAPTAQVLVDNPAAYPGVVTRAPPSSQDQQLGYLGPITQILESYFNYGVVHAAGFDADVSYAFDTRMGRITPSISIANVYRWQSALSPGAPAIDGLGNATLAGVGWAPRWKGTASVAWKSGPISTNVAGRYIGQYKDYQDIVANTNEGGNTWIFDASARYELGDALAATSPSLAHSYVSLAGVNIFNRTPPFSYTPAWYDYEEYDLRGRYLRLTVGARF